MSPKAPTMPGAPVWVDLMSSDTEAARDFYSGLFGWQCVTGDEDTYGGYVSFRLDGKRVAGLMRKDSRNTGPDAWSVYLGTTDAAATADAVTAAGGRNLFAPSIVPEMGTMGFAVDPSGAGIGYWQPGKHDGFELWETAGSSTWYELMTNRYREAVGFYVDVFGWNAQRMSDTSDFRYTVLADTTIEKQYAGIMDAASFLPKGVPSYWQVYFGAQDVDACCTAAVRLGGAVVEPASDSGFGRFATLSDTTGAVFRVIQKD